MGNSDSTGTGFKFGWVFLRVLQLIFAAIVVGLVGRYLRLASDYGAHAANTLVYTQVIACLSVIMALLFGWPWGTVYYMFPLDIAMWVMWMVSFGLQVHLAGGTHCNSDWYWHNWGWYWGRPVRPIPVGLTQADVGDNGCSSMRTAWAFSFICGWMFFFSGLAGAYGFINHRDMRHGRSTPPEYATQDGKPETSTTTDGMNNFNTETGERV